MGLTSEHKVKWRYDRAAFRKWQLGRTGFPFVDAGMRELLKTGYLSHLHRQCCAAFLVRDLQIDWRWGAEHFEATLVDYTPDANWGNWAYRILPRPCLAVSREKWILAEQTKQKVQVSRSGGAANNKTETETQTSSSNQNVASRDNQKVKRGSSSNMNILNAPAKGPRPGGQKEEAAVEDRSGRGEATSSQHYSENLLTPIAQVGRPPSPVPHLSTMECVVWPVVHDSRMEHTLFWVPELQPIFDSLGPDFAREPWRALDLESGDLPSSMGSSSIGEKRRGKHQGQKDPGGEVISIRPYKDSPLWFCAANRTNWDYEYYWLRPGKAVVWQTDDTGPTSRSSCSFKDSTTATTSIAAAGMKMEKPTPFSERRYWPPMVTPVNLILDLKQLPIQNFVWKETV
ncbi:unnamed protein product [Amoebophrya sp. A25]|nr:unnamed protein product [Amoebophrya sp. A25]|eukprot:GSA25T00009444001.1